MYVSSGCPELLQDQTPESRVAVIISYLWLLHDIKTETNFK